MYIHFIYLYISFIYIYCDIYVSLIFFPADLIYPKGLRVAPGGDEQVNQREREGQRGGQGSAAGAGGARRQLRPEDRGSRQEGEGERVPHGRGQPETGEEVVSGPSAPGKISPLFCGHIIFFDT